MALVVDALNTVPSAWPTFEIRALLRGNAQDRPSDIHYLHLEGTFSSATLPLETRLATPEVVSGRVSVETVASYLSAWSRGEAIVVQGRKLQLPVERVGPLIPEHSRLDELTYVALVGTAYPAWVSQVMGWQLYASSNQTPSQEESQLQNAFSLTAYRSGSRSPEFSLHHLGRDITRLSGPGVGIILPLPLVLNASVEDQDVRIHLHLREPLTHDAFWVAAAAGPWDLRRPRQRSWTIAARGDDGWVEGTSTLGGAAVPPAIAIWVGRGDDPEVITQIPVAPRGATVQQAAAVHLLYSSTSLADSLQPRVDARGNVAQDFEVAVANVMGALGYACINVGIPVKAEGLDILAFHQGRRDALLISVTTGGGLSKKLSGLLRRRSPLAKALKAWTCRLLLVTPVARDDLAPGDLRDCSEAGVVLLTGTELQRGPTDMEALRKGLEQLLASVQPIALP